jgi:hypothetical protein
MTQHLCVQAGESLVSDFHQLSGGDPSHAVFSGQVSAHTHHAATAATAAVGSSRSQQQALHSQKVEAAILKQQLCLRLPAVLMYWAAYQPLSRFVADATRAGFDSIMLTGTAAQVFEYTVASFGGQWPEGKAPVTSEAAVSDTLQYAVLALNRLQGLRQPSAGPSAAGSNSGSSSSGSGRAGKGSGSNSGGSAGRGSGSGRSSGSGSGSRMAPTPQEVQNIVLGETSLVAVLSVLACLPRPLQLGSSSVSGIGNLAGNAICASSSSCSSRSAATTAPASLVDVALLVLQSPDCWKQHATAVLQAVEGLVRGILSSQGQPLVPWDESLQPAFLGKLILTASSAAEQAGHGPEPFISCDQSTEACSVSAE